MRVAEDWQMRTDPHPRRDGLPGLAMSGLAMSGLALFGNNRLPAFSGRLLAIAVMCLGATGVAEAQTTPASPSLPPSLPTTPGTTSPNVEVDQERIFGDDSSTFSPLALLGGFGLDITASVVTEFSDNVARVEGEDELRYGLESKSDWSFRPTISLAATRPVGRQAAFFNLSVGRRFYVRNTVLDRDFLSAGGGLQWQLGVRCSGVVQGDWSRRGTQFATFDDVVPSRTENLRFTASASCPTAGGLTPNISYDYFGAKTRVADEFAGQIDRSFADVKSHGISGGVGYRLSTRGEVGVQAQWRRSTYPNQFVPSGENNYNIINGLNGFVNYRFGRSLSANGTLGYSKVKRPAGLGDGFSGTVWSIGLDYAGPRLGASINGGRSVNGSSGGNANFSVAKHVAGNISYRVNNRLSASAGAISRNSDMGGFIYVPGTNYVDVRKLDRYFVGLDYKMNRLMAFSLDYNHQRLRTEPTGFGYRENSVTFGIRATL